LGVFYLIIGNYYFGPAGTGYRLPELKYAEAIIFHIAILAPQLQKDEFKR